MAEIAQAPQQYKQPSRKGKKAWRKNVDISEVQEGLENVREEIIIGGVIAEKTSEELFTTDTTGSAAIQNAYNKTHKSLKADQILAQRSSISAVDSRKRSASRITNGVLEPSKKRRTGVSYKDLERLRRIAYHGDAATKDSVKSDGQASYDPWMEQPKAKEECFSFLQEKQPVREPGTLKQAPISLAANGKAFPAVKKPEAGKSYNPVLQDWLELIDKEGKKEVEAEKKRLKEEREEKERMERALATAAEPDPESEVESAWESEWEGIQSEPEGEWAQRKRPERKTQQQRKKIKRRKETERQALWEAKQRKREQQVAQVRALAKAVEEKERARAMAVTSTGGAHSSDAEDDELRRRRFGKIPIPQAPLEVVLADELQESLRLLKPEGNLLKDRFRNLLINGKIETRRPITQPKKPKTTVTEKWSYKDWKL
ncbi:P60-like protein, partial [Patellaria atrata CBS 101060]